jgi:hypothetical protein
MIKEVSFVFITPIWANESKERNKKGRNLFIQSSPHNLDELKSGKVSLPQNSIFLLGNLKINFLREGRAALFPPREPKLLNASYSLF